MTQDKPAENPPLLMARCDCGFEARGLADDMVSAMQKHAGGVHNMVATREQILERSRPV
jgi:predicted small metal-binding protein